MVQIQNVPHDALYQNCTNGFAKQNKGATTALDKNVFERHLLNHWFKFKTI